MLSDDSHEWKIHQDLLYEQSGEGLLSSARKKHLDRLKSRPKDIDSFMKDRGDRKMESILVCRTPIQKSIEKVLNLLSKGQLEKTKKKYNYDDIFHLYAVITFEDGEMYEIQKNDLVEIAPFRGDFQKNSECKKSSVPAPKSFNEVMLNLEKEYPNSLYLYQAWNYNCQDFLNKFTKEAGITGLSDFIMQYFSEPFRKKNLRKITRFLTDMSASIKRYIFGKGDDELYEEAVKDRKNCLCI
jgi:hypothetical protein